VRSWLDAFRVLAAVLPDGPVIIVLDELPWLAEQDEIFDGALQTAWDRLLSRRPVLLLLLGSDLHMMERLTAYDRPFFGRADNLLLGPGCRESCEPGQQAFRHCSSLNESARIQHPRCSAFPRRRC
jgi:hypothetical protein